MEKIYKSGTNKGNRRIWIEGKVLLDHQWTKGVLFTKTLPEQNANDKTIVLVAQRTKRPADADRIIWYKHKHKVAGTETRPIIDLNGKYLNGIFTGCTHFRAVICRDWIAITPCDEAGQ